MTQPTPAGASGRLLTFKPHFKTLAFKTLAFKTLAGGLLMASLGGAVAQTASGSGQVPGQSTRQNALPASAWIASVGYVRQTLNNCGPAALIAAIAPYGYTADQGELARELKASPTGYMTTSVIAPFLQRIGLNTTYYQQGQITHIKRLVAAGVPVIVLQYLDRPGGIPHFRTIRGYDDKAGVIWFSDSMYGPASYLSYADFDRLWNLYNRSFFPVYPKGWERQAQLVVSGNAVTAAAGGR